MKHAERLVALIYLGAFRTLDCNILTARQTNAGRFRSEPGDKAGSENIFLGGWVYAPDSECALQFPLIPRWYDAGLSRGRRRATQLGNR